MTLGNDLQNQVNAIINDRNFRSELSLQTLTITESSDGGYSPNTKDYGTASTLYCIPSNWQKNVLGKIKLGDLDTGQIRFLIKSSETISTNDKVTFEGEPYTIDRIEPIHFNGVDVAKAIILSKEVS